MDCAGERTAPPAAAPLQRRLWRQRARRPRSTRSGRFARYDTG
ncbi:hypothetical protein BN2497_11419 [Janthinobacterium sp. CG23_2]|nr:hypothetical protein BN2497_11419 [Janthinobacterium sp. CG23_2]CUU32107.1 hypothetical protein BN3177_11419 [Janthinobacterium sp. CG23_2]